MIPFPALVVAALAPAVVESRLNSADNNYDNNNNPANNANSISCGITRNSSVFDSVD